MPRRRRNRSPISELSAFPEQRIAHHGAEEKRDTLHALCMQIKNILMRDEIEKQNVITKVMEIMMRLDNDELDEWQVEYNIDNMKDLLIRIETSSVLCKVCMDSNITMMFLPCKHMITCSLCALVLLTCPICRTPINEWIKPIQS